MKTHRICQISIHFFGVLTSQSILNAPTAAKLLICSRFLEWVFSELASCLLDDLLEVGSAGVPKDYSRAHVLDNLKKS